MWLCSDPGGEALFKTSGCHVRARSEGGRLVLGPEGPYWCLDTPFPPCPVGSPHGEGADPWGGDMTNKWRKRDFPFFNPSRFPQLGLACCDCVSI